MVSKETVVVRRLGNLGSNKRDVRVKTELIMCIGQSGTRKN